VNPALLTGGKGARDVSRALFPDGLRFYPEPVKAQRSSTGRRRGVFRIEGAACPSGAFSQ